VDSDTTTKVELRVRVELEARRKLVQLAAEHDRDVTRMLEHIIKTWRPEAQPQGDLINPG
jgi:hypothetical protein